MKIEVSLFGCFGEFEPGARLALDLPGEPRIHDVRAAVDTYGRQHWPRFKSGLLAVSAFASEDCLLRDPAPVPANGRLAILPPVSGG
jgi:molybdopterin synthase sulfur carrier subunit